VAARRLVFLDVDGTIIDHDGRISSTVGDAVRRARAAGHLVFLCTGRSSREIPEPVSSIGFDGAILAGGGFIRLGDQLLAAHVRRSNSSPGPGTSTTR